MKRKSDTPATLFGEAPSRPAPVTSGQGSGPPHDPNRPRDPSKPWVSPEERTRQYIEYKAWEWRHGNFPSPYPEAYHIRRLGPECWLLYAMPQSSGIHSTHGARLVGRAEVYHDSYALYSNGPAIAEVNMIDLWRAWDLIPRKLEDLVYLDLDLIESRARLCRLLRLRAGAEETSLTDSGRAE